MDRKGFTVVEVLVALTLLAVVVLGLSSTTARLNRTAVDNRQKVVAIELLQDRLRLIAMDEEYAQLRNRYEGVENDIPGYPGFRRTTTIQRINESGEGGRSLDYYRVTVTVQGPGLDAPVSRTTTIAAP
ncbi:MAG TPA: prepilin-type N-terminal cleavage/methylation domain-containing protein [Longimicrobiales bacterium]|nr:prepilin-type N-terminal cleavage/methylation domain-containing protein [Longimicrobiales bacterium]